MNNDPPDAPRVCESDVDCDDGLFCNGPSTCTEEGPCEWGEPVDCDDGIECTVDLCSNDQGGCVNQAPDVDGDGHGDVTCLDAEQQPLGDDCDDADARRYPGNTAIVDP